MLPPSAMYNTERLLSKLMEVMLVNSAMPMPYIPSSMPCIIVEEPARLTRSEQAALAPDTVMRQVRMTVPAGGPDEPSGTLSAMYMYPVDVSIAAAVGHCS